MVEVPFDSDTMTDGLSELTTLQNPNPENSDLCYGFDTMSREKKYWDSN